MAARKRTYRSGLIAAGLLIIIAFFMSAVLPGLKNDAKSILESSEYSKVTISKVSMQAAGELRIFYLDAGQADAIFMELPNGTTVAIDSGDGSDQAEIAKKMKDAGVTKIDVFVATHPHADHIGGMAYLINGFDTGTIYMTKVSSTTRTFENLLLAIANKKLKVNTAKAGLMISPDPEVKMEIIAPLTIIPGEMNENSVAIRMDYGKTSFLFMGDAGIEEETAILGSGKNLKADVIKIGHHGSLYSSGLPFLKEVRPDIAIISAGKDNDYGHPSPVVIDRLSGMGVRVLRTDMDGDIVIVSDGNTIDVLP
ncbi:MAG: ComEC/Rec2 family competence protein [Saccharofermentanales bacterium]